MKKVGTYLTRLMLFMVLSLMIVSGRGITAKAVTVTYDKVNIIHMINKKTTGIDEGFEVDMDAVNMHVSNIRTNSQCLKAKRTVYSYQHSTSDNYEYISVYATKKGTYFVTFDIVDGKGRYISTEQSKIIVETYKDSFKGYKSIKIGKTNVLKECMEDKYSGKVLTLNKPGKIKIKMKKGYTLKDIIVERCVPDKYSGVYRGGVRSRTEYITEHIKNGDMVKLSEISHYHNGRGKLGGLSVEYSDHIFEYTGLTIIYIDKNGIERKNEIDIRSRIK